jgi:hypothetical protein
MQVEEDVDACSYVTRHESRVRSYLLSNSRRRDAWLRARRLSAIYYTVRFQTEQQLHTVLYRNVVHNYRNYRPSLRPHD